MYLWALCITDQFVLLLIYVFSFLARKFHRYPASREFISRLTVLLKSETRFSWTSCFIKLCNKLFIDFWKMLFENTRFKQLANFGLLYTDLFAFSFLTWGKCAKSWMPRSNWAPAANTLPARKIFCRLRWRWHWKYTFAKIFLFLNNQLYNISGQP